MIFKKAEREVLPNKKTALTRTLDLPENLLEEAMKTTHIQTKTKVIITALEELIKKIKNI